MANGQWPISEAARARRDLRPSTNAEALGCGRVDIHERTFEFAVRVLKVVDSLPRTVLGRVFASQLARSGTSVGANIEEAQGGHSKAEFARRMNLARGEARETRYWLRLIAAHGLISARRLSHLTAEADELVRILTAIVKKARGTKGTS